MLDMLHSLTCLIIVHQILLIFLNFVTYTPLLGPSHLLVFEIFLNGIFININEKKSFLKTGDLKSTQHWLRFLFNKKLRNCVYFLTCILPDNMAHDFFKEFLKDSHFEDMTAWFLLRWQNLLQQISPKMMHFQA